LEKIEYRTLGSEQLTGRPFELDERSFVLDDLSFLSADIARDGPSPSLDHGTHERQTTRNEPLTRHNPRCRHTLGRNGETRRDIPKSEIFLEGEAN
jgi:hypothetical protein